MLWLGRATDSRLSPVREPAIRTFRGLRVLPYFTVTVSFGTIVTGMFKLPDVPN